MSTLHLIRVGALGHVGRFTSADRAVYLRGHRVVVRTARGLETGEVLSADGEAWQNSSDGVILRGMTDQDELLETRLEKNRHAAYDACRVLLAERNLPAVLVDVEHLFDGRGLYFYFLGPVPPEVESLTAELAEAYEAEAQIGKFAETLTAGCGPGCGTDAAPGGGCGDCGAGCAIAGACGTKRV